MKDPEGVGHTHADWSSFQMFRKGRWLTKETSGYSDLIKGVNSGNKVDTDVSEADAHNTIFIGKAGDMKSIVGYWQLEHPDVTRLESKDNYVYAALDLTGSFKTSRTDVASLYNPFVENVVREYIFIRPLETLIIFDRLKSKTSSSTNANDVLKTALIHFQTNPKIEDANHVLVTVGGQALHLSTLLPSNPSYTVENEGGTVGQYRLQVSTKGEEQSYMLNILQARDASGSN